MYILLVNDALLELAAVADALCTLPALEHVEVALSFPSLPAEPGLWASLGSKLRLSWSQLVRLASPQEEGLTRSWLPPELFSLPGTVELQLVLLQDCDAEAPVGAAAEGLDRLPGLRWLEVLYCETPPAQLWSCRS